ncbi:recombinase family protein [Bradyrhizobium sp. 149]|nr:recombinase family protein [Bradyrhizobium sp. 149]
MPRSTIWIIVRTYTDEGRSGLRIHRRQGLIELIDDVRSGRADFYHILVYDVSRWGSSRMSTRARITSSPAVRLGSRSATAPKNSTTTVV